MKIFNFYANLPWFALKLALGLFLGLIPLSHAVGGETTSPPGIRQTQKAPDQIPDQILIKRLEAGNSGQYLQHWEKTGRYHSHPEDLRLKNEIMGYIAGTLETLRKQEQAEQP